MCLLKANERYLRQLLSALNSVKMTSHHSCPSALLPPPLEAQRSVDCSQATPPNSHESTIAKQLLLSCLGGLLRCLLRLTVRAVLQKIPSAEVKVLVYEEAQVAIDEGVSLVTQAAKNYMDGNSA